MRLENLFREVVDPTGRRANWSMVGFVEAWQDLVDEVEAGYGGDLYEYESELLVREDLERAMVSSELASVDGWGPISAQIVIADSRFRGLLGPVVREESPWWKSRVPARAGAEFVEDVKRIYGVAIEVFE